MPGCVEVHGPCAPRKLHQAGARRVQLEEAVETPRCLVDVLGPQHVDDRSGRVAYLPEVVVGGVEDSLRCAVICKKRSEAVGVEIRLCGRQIGEVDDETQSARFVPASRGTVDMASLLQIIRLLSLIVTSMINL